MNHTLEHLRSQFLEGKTGYWRDERTLELYDQSFAERIGWKWDDVLREHQTELQSLFSKSSTWIDWGCGTGIASRKCLSFSHKPPDCLILVDHSPLARSFARQKIQTVGGSRQKNQTVGRCPDENQTVGGVRVEGVSRIDQVPPDALLLVSHVVNELSEAQLEELSDLAGRARHVLWIEAGTKTHAERLISIRDRLSKQMTIVGPCTHQKPCPINPEKDWCHHFAKTPSFVFQSAYWSSFAREQGIDLHRLPYSYLIASKDPVATHLHQSRLIGLPKSSKGRWDAMICNADGCSKVCAPIRKLPLTHEALEAGKRTLPFPLA